MNPAEMASSRAVCRRPPGEHPHIITASRINISKSPWVSAGAKSLCHFKSRLLLKV